MFVGRDHFKHSSDKHERSLRGGGWPVEAGSSVGQCTCQDAARDRSAPPKRTLSYAASSNGLESASKNFSASNSNEYVEGNPISCGISVVTNASKSKLRGQEDDGNSPGCQPLSGSNIGTKRNDVESRQRHKRRRRNANASTQTLPTVEEQQDADIVDIRDCPTDSGHAAASRRTKDRPRTAAGGTSAGDLDNDDVQSCLAEIIRLMLRAPTSDAEPRQSHRGAARDPVAADPRYRHPHHHSRQKQEQQQQQQPDHWRPVNDYICTEHGHRRPHPVHSHLSSCASCQMHLPDFTDPVVITSTPGTWSDSHRARTPHDSSHHDSCPRCSKAFRSHPVVLPRRISFANSTPPPATSSRPTPTERPSSSPTGRPEAAAESDNSATPMSAGSAERGRQSAEKALRRRIERVIVEMMKPDGDGHESEFVATVRQAIIDSAASPPTLSNDKQ